MNGEGELDPTTEMYATAGPLQVRIRTHERYTQPQVDLIDWVVAHVSWHDVDRVLDIGCGSGAYVESVCRQLESGARFLAADVSWGMLQDLVAASLPPAACPLNADAMRLPFPDGSCDAVLANHMLYEVPVIERAIAGAHRVLRPGGRLVAATNARDSMVTFVREMEAACGALGYPTSFPEAPSRVRFTLENGASFLEPVFGGVRREILSSALVFEEPDPAVAYIDSLRLIYASRLPGGLAWEAMLKQVRRQIEAKISLQGEYRVPKTTGFFIAVR